MDSKFFLFFIFLNILNSLYSQLLGPTVEFTPTEISDSMNRDLAECPCDLSPFCDYNCYCDKNCTDDKGNFKLKEKDFVYNNNRMEEFKCQSWENNFKYNKNKAGINIRDHIFNLMCIHFDRSGDKGEFYEKNPIQNDGSEWSDNFFRGNVGEDKQTAPLYKPDSNGYCISSTIAQYKNGEYSCIDRGRAIVTNITNNISNYNRFGQADFISKVRYNQTTGKYDVLFTPSASYTIEFSVFWRSNSTSQGRPKGYMQGSPIKLRNINDNNLYYDEIFFPINNNAGKCITNNENDAINIKSLLFKNNAIFSCITNDYAQTYIYNNILSKMTLCSSPGDTNCNINIAQTEPSGEASESINMELNIFSQKEGTENNQYYKISFSRLKISHPSNGNNRELPLIFKIKFYDISESVIKNSKNGKKTSIKDLPDEVINILSGIYK